jgi:hypothetical protein
MKIVALVVFIVATAVLVVLGLSVSSGSSGPTLTGAAPTADTPEEAIVSLLTAVQHHEWSNAHSELANAETFGQDQFTREFAGRDGSLRSLSTLQSWDLKPLHATSTEAQVRTTLHWSTAVGSVDDVHDLKVTHTGQGWKVVWPQPVAVNVPAQVIPVNYLRWDLVAPQGEQEGWGGGGVDAPRVRILSMNAVDYKQGSVVMGEVVNEDTIPAFVNVNATLLDKNDRAIADESSFDKIAHVLLPKQVSPYRIDFPTVGLQRVKDVHMDVKATLVPASADPIIGVMDQKRETDAQGRTTLQGTLLNLSGMVVNVPHVIATFYDNGGKVIWVSDGYVEHALYPQTPEPFAVEIPAKAAASVENYHVVVNQYSIARQ